MKFKLKSEYGEKEDIQIYGKFINNVLIYYLRNFYTKKNDQKWIKIYEINILQSNRN